MLKNRFTNLLDLSIGEVRSWMNTFDTVLVDCDGTLWQDYVPIAGAPATVNKLKSLGKRVLFVTNNGTKTRRELWQLAVSLGFEIAETDIIAPTHSIAEYLKNLKFEKDVYLIGGTAMQVELEAVGIKSFGIGPDTLQGSLGDYVAQELANQQWQSVGAVVVSFDEHFTFCKMMKASNCLGQNPDCLFITTNVDAVSKYPQYHIPGTGSIVKAIETCVDREALQLGKPNPLICESLLREGVLVPERTLMIGDCCKIDVVFGKNCGFQTMLVGTGNYQLKDIEEMMEDFEKHKQNIPDAFLPQIGYLLPFIY